MKCTTLEVDFYNGRDYVCVAAPVVKNPPTNAEDIRDTSSIPGLRRYPGGGNGNPFQYPCLENLMGRGAWWATVHGVTKSHTEHAPPKET